MKRFSRMLLALLVVVAATGGSGSQPLQSAVYCVCCYPAGDTRVCGFDTCCTWHLNTQAPTCTFTVICDDGTVTNRHCGSSCP